MDLWLLSSVLLWIGFAVVTPAKEHVSTPLLGREFVLAFRALKHKRTYVTIIWLLITKYLTNEGIIS